MVSEKIKELIDKILEIVDNANLITHKDIYIIELNNYNLFFKNTLDIKYNNTLVKQININSNIESIISEFTEWYINSQYNNINIIEDYFSNK